MLWIGIMLLMLSTGVAIKLDKVTVCDSSSSLKTAPLAYSNYIRYLYLSGLSILPLSKPDNCDEFGFGNDVVKGIILGITFGQAWVDVDIENRKAFCADVYQNILNYMAGVGLTVNWPLLLPKSYPTNPPTHTLHLQYDSSYVHDFVAKSYKTTVWTSVWLMNPAVLGFPTLYELSPDLFNQRLSFIKGGFKDMTGYVGFATTLSSKFMQVWPYAF